MLVAVLPIRGSLASSDREVVREMLHHRLATLEMRVVDNAWVDRRLASAGLIDSRDDLVSDALEPATVCRALDVDGYVVGSEFEKCSTDLLLYYRRSLRGHLELWNRDGARVWWSQHSKARSGGLLVQSGQVYKALRDTTGRGAPIEFVRNIEGLLDDMLATLPEPREASAPDVMSEPTIRAASIERGEEAHEDLWSVRIETVAGSTVTFAIDGREGYPMTESKPGEYVGSYVRTPAPVETRDPRISSVVVMDRFGHRARIQPGSRAWPPAAPEGGQR
ncbi:MAG: hypothetical protein H6832_07640 [Planctomycetes bacterium]|nr:hypothetical protein [Planctomycetota bacterium]MCB9918261.1 hypothetical protein [Planctomycetota bacterium]